MGSIWNTAANFVGNPTLAPHPAGIPDGWTEFLGATDITTYDDTNPAYSVMTIVPVSDRAMWRTTVSGLTDTEDYTLYVYVVQDSTSGNNGYRSVTPSRRTPGADFTTEGWYAVGVTATSTSSDTWLGVGQDGNVTGTLEVSRPSFVAGFVGGITADAQVVGPLSIEPGYTNEDDIILHSGGAYYRTTRNIHNLR